MKKSSPEKVIQNSDDDDGDYNSESSLEDLTNILTSRISDIRSKQTQGKSSLPNETSSFSTRSTRFRKAPDYHSPVEAKQKYKYDLKSLAKSAQSYDNAEASSNRVREMFELVNRIDETDTNISNLTREDLLNSVEVYGDSREQKTNKIRSVIEKTEASFRQHRWYFFHSKPKNTELMRKKFPLSSIPDNWRHEMGHSETRKQAFISGLVEDVVSIRKSLPDDFFLWLIDEVCREDCEVLRNCYVNVLTKSSSQIQRLVSPELIKNLFLCLNGTLEAINIKGKIELVEEIPEYYADYDWSVLLSILSFFSQVANVLSQESRMQLTCILLRMSLDKFVMRNIDIFFQVQKTLENVCTTTPNVNWTSYCQEVCENVFCFIEKPNLRLQIVESLSSVTVRTHDLRRRLASCFLFNNLIFAKKPSQHYFNFPMFLNRLKVSDFKCKPKTDYCELRALVMLMEIAVDDGQSSHFVLDDESKEESFNINIEKLGLSVKEIFSGTDTQDSGNISKIQAKEAVEAFSRRITHTMRTKPKLVHEWFVNHDRKTNNMREKQAMENFVAKLRYNKRPN
ncbi:hypothetical protein HI914_02792 [Erysiphe necator]|nr:hypothetical protein HI914_02792 [Erysiphe necator]